MMDRRILRGYLAQAESHIDQATRLVEAQTRLVARMEPDDSSTHDAQTLLNQFERTLRNLRADRDVILTLLKQEDRRPLH